MIVQLSRRVLGFAVSTFALLGFLAVPLGDKTGFQHAKAVLGSEEAKGMGKALRTAADHVQRSLMTELRHYLQQARAEFGRPNTYRPTGSPPDPTKEPTPGSR